MKFSEIEISEAKTNISMINPSNGKYKTEFYKGYINFWEKLMGQIVCPSTQSWMKLGLNISAKTHNNEDCAVYGNGDIFGDSFFMDTRPLGSSSFRTLYDEEISKTFDELRTNPHINLNLSKLGGSGNGTLPADSSDFNVFIWAKISMNVEKTVSGSLICENFDKRSNLDVSFSGTVDYEKGFYYVIKIYKKEGKELLYESDLIGDRLYRGSIKNEILPLGSELYATIDFYHLVNVNGAWFGKTYYDEEISSKTVESQPFSIVDTSPKILSLDPSGVDVNKDKPVVISWVAERQESYSLKINETIYNGLTETTIIIPAGTLKSGDNTATLTISNTVNFLMVNDIKTVYFRAYGKPDMPVLDNKLIYETALPKITWESTEQIEYRLRVFKNENLVEDSGKVNGTDKFYVIKQALLNETQYKLELTIKNKFGLCSDVAQKTITTSFDVLPSPSIALIADNFGNIVVNVINEENAKFAKSEIWRKTEFSDWKRMAVNLPLVSAFRDSTVASNVVYQYKALTFTKLGGVSESEIKSIKAEILQAFFVDVESLQSTELPYTASAEPAGKFKRIVDKVLVQYDGKKAPDLEKGEVDYTVANFSSLFRNYTEYKQFEHFMESAKLILFRDSTGHKIYGHVTQWGDEEENAVGYIKTSFTFTETAFIEKDVFDGGRKLRLIRLDEGWKLDDELTLDMLIYDD